MGLTRDTAQRKLPRSQLFIVGLVVTILFLATRDARSSGDVIEGSGLDVYPIRLVRLRVWRGGCDDQELTNEALQLLNSAHPLPSFRNNLISGMGYVTAPPYGGPSTSLKLNAHAHSLLTQLFPEANQLMVLLKLARIAQLLDRTAIV